MSPRQCRAGLRALVIGLTLLGPLTARAALPECLAGEPWWQGLFEVEPHWDPEGWSEHHDGSMVIDREPDQDAYRIPLDCDPWEAGQLRWVDRGHYLFSRGLCWPTQWLDGMFGDPDDQSRHASGTTARLLATQVWTEGGDLDSDLRFRVRAHLPQLEERLSLIFASEQDFEDEHPGLQNLPEDSVSLSDQRARAGLRWVLQQAEHMDLDFDVGVRSDFKLYARGRYRIMRPLSEHWSLRFTETVDWRDLRGFRSRSMFDLDRPLDSTRLLRLTSFFETSEERTAEGVGWRWRQSAVYAVQLNQRAALRFLMLAEGDTEPATRVSAYRGSVAWRRNAWRPWLFVDVEPFVAWEREYGYETRYGVIARLEVLFGMR